MKTIDLNDYCIQEMNTKEMNETNGGTNDIVALAVSMALCQIVEMVRNLQN